MNTVKKVGRSSAANRTPVREHAAAKVFRLKPLVASMLLASGMPAANAALEAHGPISAFGYPTWYQDQTGLVLEFCNNQSALELEGSWCLLLPGDVAAAPEAFPNNFAEEHFYWAANAGSNAAALNPADNSPIKIMLVLALEGAFATGPVKAGDQLVFSRVRIIINPLPYDGDYVVYTPFGRFEFPNQTAGDRLFNTVDIGLAPGDFEGALHGDVGPFLLPSSNPGGAEVPPIPDLLANPAVDLAFQNLLAAGGGTPYPNNGKKYIADPARLGPVTGASCTEGPNCQIDPTSGKPAWLTSAGLRDPNVFRVEGPNGFEYETSDFTLMGRVHEGAITGKVSVDRASYTANSTQSNDLSVFVTATSATQGRIPAGPLPAQVPPQLSLFPAPCGADPNGNPIAPAGLSGMQMLSQGNLQFAKQSNLPGLAPDSICIEQIGVNAAGSTVTSFTDRSVTDQIKITDATYDPASQLLSVTASSSDKTKDIILTVDGVGDILIAQGSNSGSISKATLAAPATVFVRSSEGGFNQAQVDTGTLAGVPILPVANNDNLTATEDTVAQLSVLANDTNVSGGVITVTSQPGGGSAVAAGTVITYTPRPNYFGTDSFTYSVSVGGNISNTATVLLNVAGVNDAPVASPDNGGAVRGVASTINLLANDSDADGASDLNGGTITGTAANLAALGLTDGQTFTSGGLSFTPPAATAAGTYSFTYTAVDKAGAESGATNVNITVAASDNPLINRAQYTQKSFRWVIDGSTAVSTGQTITLKYTNGVHKPDGDTRRCSDVPVVERVSAAGHTVGTATVNATNNWTLDTILSPTTGERNPTNNGNGTTSYWCSTPTAVTATSSLTGAVTPAFPITLK